jgi:hypothetical protein
MPHKEQALDCRSGKSVVSKYNYTMRMAPKANSGQSKLAKTATRNLDVAAMTELIRKEERSTILSIQLKRPLTDGKLT